jgi:hypothetical protein
MRLLLVALLVCAVSPVTSAQTKPGSSDFEIVHIDGRRNPEMIPEWSAWEEALTALAKGSGLLPDVLAAYFSTAEAALLRQEAKAHVERERDYHERVKRLQLLAAKERVTDSDRRRCAGLPLADPGPISSTR